MAWLYHEWRGAIGMSLAPENDWLMRPLGIAAACYVAALILALVLGGGP